MQPVHTAWLLFWIPLLTVHTIWIWSSLVGSIEQCLPYWSGCTSISRAARSSDALFLFRSVMTMNAMLLIIYWLQIRQFLSIYKSSAITLQCLGIISALFLVLYANFLGTHGDTYRLLRQYGVTIYFSFGVLAHMLFARQLFKINETKIRLYVQGNLGLSLLILMLGISSIICNLLLENEQKDRWENIIEWHFALVMNMYFLLTALIWKRLQFFYRSNIVTK